MAEEAKALSDKQVSTRAAEQTSAGDSPAMITVAANQVNGTPTGIHVKSGDRLAFAATGARYWGSGDDACSDANGTPGRPTDDELPVTVEGGNFGTLAGRVDTWHFLIGATNEVTMQADGELHLLMNDQRGCYSDNGGFLKVTVSRLHEK